MTLQDACIKLGKVRNKKFFCESYGVHRKQLLQNTDFHDTYWQGTHCYSASQV